MFKRTDRISYVVGVCSVIEPVFMHCGTSDDIFVTCLQNL